MPSFSHAAKYDAIFSYVFGKYTQQCYSINIFDLYACKSQGKHFAKFTICLKGRFDVLTLETTPGRTLLMSLL